MKVKTHSTTYNYIEYVIQDAEFPEFLYCHIVKYEPFLIRMSEVNYIELDI